MKNKEPGYEMQKEYISVQTKEILKELGITPYLDKVEVPEFVEEFNSLKDKVVLMVDDDETLIERYIPLLLVATQGKAKFLYQNNGTLDEVLSKIEGIKADIVLMDESLGEVSEPYLYSQDSSDEPELIDSLFGTIVISKLRERGYEGKLICFSGDPMGEWEWKRCGGNGSIQKKMDGIVSIQELGKLIDKPQEEEK